MSDNKAFYHLFETRNNSYIYDVNTDVIIKVDKCTYNLLKNKDITCSNSNIESDLNNNVIEKLKNQGYLSSIRAEEVINPIDNILEYYLNNAVFMLTLQITQQCNLRCSYCAYSGKYENRVHSSKDMNFETAKKGIEFLIKHSRDLDNVNIGFYGGEPLLRFDFIKQCISYVKEIGEGKKITFSMTTNGTIFTDEIIDYLYHNDVDITISLDGPKKIHDKNRKFPNGQGSFDKIMENIDYIKSKYPDYLDSKISFNVVLDGKNEFSCINDFFTNYDAIKDQNINSSIVSDLYSIDEFKLSQNFLEETAYEDFKGFLNRVRRLDEKYISKIFQKDLFKIKEVLHDHRIPQKHIPKKIHHGGPCVPGVTRLFMSTNGIFYPCEKVSESSEVMKIGDVDTGFNIEKIRKLINIGKLTEENCKNCWAFRYCYMCAAFADTLDGLCAKKKLSFCDEIKINIEYWFIIYCTLKEYGYDFEDSNIKFVDNIS